MFYEDAENSYQKTIVFLSFQIKELTNIEEYELANTVLLRLQEVIQEASDAA